MRARPPTIPSLAPGTDLAGGGQGPPRSGRHQLYTFSGGAGVGVRVGARVSAGGVRPHARADLTSTSGPS